MHAVCVCAYLFELAVSPVETHGAHGEDVILTVCLIAQGEQEKDNFTDFYCYVFSSF